MKPKVIIQKEIINIKVEINELENRKAFELVSEIEPDTTGKIKKLRNKRIKE